MWEQARRIAPDHPFGYSDGAVALRESGDLAAAEQVIDAALTRFPDFLGGFIVWADLAVRRQDWPEANARWEEVRKRFPEDGHGYIHGSFALLQLGRADDADLLLHDAVRAHPNDIWVVATWAYFAQQHLDAEEALRRFAAVRRLVPHHPEGYLGAARSLRNQRRFHEAEAMLAGALARFPNELAPVVEFAAVADARGDREDSIERWAIVRERFPDQEIGYVHAVELLRAAGRHQETEALLAAAVERFPGNAHIWFTRGWVASDRGDWVEAERRWAEARAGFPAIPAPYVEGARALEALGRFDEADALIADARARFPADHGVAIAWMDQARRRHDWGTVAERLEAVRQIFPDDPSVVVDGSRALSAAGRLDDADAMLAEAMQRPAPHEAIIRAWAEVAMRRQIWPDAMQRWEIARQHFPNMAVAYAEGSRALRMAGRPADAEALLDDAVVRFPLDSSVRFAWADLANDRADAYRRWETARSLFPTEAAPWIGSAAALVDAHRWPEADALLTQGMAELPHSQELMFHWALRARHSPTAGLAFDRWRQVRETFPEFVPGYTFGASTLLDAGRFDDAEALISAASERFPHDTDVMRLGAEIAVRRGELDRAVDRFVVATRMNPGDIGLARRWIETLDALQRHDDTLAALDTVRRIWPRDGAFLRRRAALAIKIGRFDQVRELWRSIAADPGLSEEAGCDIAWAIYQESPPADIARDVLLFLLREKDTGTRDWLPVLAAMIQTRGLKPHLAHQAREIMDAADEPGETATVDVLRCALLYEYSDDDIRRYLKDYVARGRVALTGHLFCQNYWKTKTGMFERFTAVFEEYLAEKLREPKWIREDNATELLAYLNFAAVHSDTAYADLVHAMRTRLDLGAMQSLGLHTIEGAAANIALMTRVDASTAATPKRRLRIAICVSGQLRGFQQAFATWRHLRLEDHDVSVFVHVWKEIGRNWQRIWSFAAPNPKLYDTLVGPSGLAILRGRYPNLVEAAVAAAAENNEADEAMLRDVYNTPFVRIEDDRSDQFRGRHNLWKMHYKIEQAHRLALEDGRKFDLMIRLRPDREFLPGDAPDWNAVHANSRDRKVVFTDSPYLFTERQTWLGDQFAVGTQEVMDVYSAVSSDMEQFAFAGAFPPDVPKQINPHTNLFYLTFYRGLLGRAMPAVTFGALLDPAMLSAANVLALIQRDVVGRTLDDFDLQMIAACQAALPVAPPPLTPPTGPGADTSASQDQTETEQNIQQRALRAEEAGDWPTAAEAWATHLARFPLAWVAFAGRAKALRHMGQIEQAEAVLRDGVAHFDNATGLLMILTDLLAASGRLSEAYAVVTDALVRQPDKPELLFMGIELAVRLQRSDDAFTIWQRMPTDTEDMRLRKIDTACDILRLAPAEAAMPALLTCLATEADTGEFGWCPRSALFLHSLVLNRNAPIARYAAFYNQNRHLFAENPYRFAWIAVLGLPSGASDLNGLIREIVEKGRFGLASFVGSAYVLAERPDWRAAMLARLRAYLLATVENNKHIGSDRDILATLLSLAITSMYVPDLFWTFMEWLRRRVRADVVPEYGPASPRAMLDRYLTGVSRAERLSNKPVLSSRPTRPLRIALCISGQLRGFRAAFPTWRSTGLFRHETSIFLHTWRSVGLNWMRFWDFLQFSHPTAHAVLARPEGARTLGVHFPVLAAATEAELATGSHVDVETLQAFYGTEFVTLEDDEHPPFAGRTNDWKMLYKVQQAHELAQSAARDFDLYVRIRPDIGLDFPREIDFHELAFESSRDHKLFLDSPVLFTAPDGNLKAGDQIAIGTPLPMTVYANTIAFDPASAALIGAPVAPKAHATLGTALFAQGVLTTGLAGMRGKQLLNPTVLSPPEIAALAEQDAATAPDTDFARQFLDACRRVAARAQ
jgi:tetratricopeptide (TPR) repeat protein